jgi:hypothetical protein
LRRVVRPLTAVLWRLRLAANVPRDDPSSDKPLDEEEMTVSDDEPTMLERQGWDALSGAGDAAARFYEGVLD